jgi:hypothetical protein
VKTVVYLDELLLVNFVAGAALLLAAGLAAGRSCTPLRLLAGGGVAAGAALLLLAPEMPFAAALAAKAGAAALSVRLTYGRQGRRGFARLYLWYLVLSLALTGAVSALAVRGAGNGAQSANLAVYLDLSPGALLIGVGGVYLALRGAARWFGAAQAVCVPARLVVQGVEIPVQAFYDTGFSLRDPAGRAAALVRYPAVREALPEALRGYLDAALAEQENFGAAPLPVPDAALRVRFVLCDTVAGRRLLPAVPAERLSRCAGGRSWSKEGILAVFCGGEAAGDAPWSLLLGADLAGPLGLDAPV